MSAESVGDPVRVLVVDPDDRTTDRLEGELDERTDDPQVMTERTREAALDRFRGEPIDCVVAEYDLPDGDGISLLESVREIDPGLPFVMYTDDDRPTVAAEAVRADATDYVLKDADTELASRVVSAVSDGSTASPDAPGEWSGTATDRIASLSEFTRDLRNGDGVEVVLERMVETATDLLGCDRCMTARREGDRLVPVATSESLSAEVVRTFDVDEGIAGRTVSRQESIVVEDVTDHELAEPKSSDLRSALSVPIGEHGVFQAVSSRPSAFAETDLEFAELLASHAREAIERIETEQRLRAERDRLAALFENLPQPAVRVKVQGDEIELDRANEPYERTFDLAAEDHTQEKFRSERVPDDEDPLDPAALYARGEPTQTDVRRITADGVRPFRLTAIPVDSGDEKLLYAVYADIQEQKRIERTLKQLHEATREMFRAEDSEAIAEITARAAIDILGFPNSGVRLYDSDANVLEPTAISEEAREVLGDRPPFGPGDDPIWSSFDEGKLVRIDDASERETVVDFLSFRSNLIVPLGDHGVMLFGAEEPDHFDDSDEYLARIIASNVQVALDRVRQTQQLKRRDERLKREVDRLEKFAAVLSHDLRNPLSIATGNLELARRVCDCSATEPHFEEIETAHDRMTQLIEDLLSLARDGRTVDETEPVELETIAERAWRTVDTAAARLTVESDDTTIEADPERLTTLLENLFRNAVEHGGESVTVTVERLPDDRGFAVADDGAGLQVDPDEAFTYGVSTNEGGTGFGLAIVREIAEAHGWEVTAETGDAGGARFVFRT